MTHPEIDVLVIGSGFGLLAGTWLGYKLRGVRETIREHREEVAEINRSRPMAGARRRAFESITRHEQVTPRELPAAKRVQLIPIDTETRSSLKPTGGVIEIKTAAESMEAVMHDLVVQALTGAGYKKTEAVSATNACHPGDRKSLEVWTAAALRRAVLSK